MKIIRTQPSEATIQAELYMALKAEGFICILEQNLALSGETWTGRGRRIRVDLILLDAEANAAGAVEVKNGRAPRHVSLFSNTRQFAKYKALGIPFTYCTHLDDIPQTIIWAKSLSSP